MMMIMRRGNLSIHYCYPIRSETNFVVNERGERGDRNLSVSNYCSNKKSFWGEILMKYHSVNARVHWKSLIPNKDSRFCLSNEDVAKLKSQDRWKWNLSIYCFFANWSNRCFITAKFQMLLILIRFTNQPLFELKSLQKKKGTIIIVKYLQIGSQRT